MTCSHVREEVAVALLTGATLPAATSDHVEHCPACMAEAEKLGALPDLLALTRPDPLGGPEPDESGLRRLLAAAASTRRRRQRRVVRGLLAAVVVLVAAVGGTVAWRSTHTGDDRTPPLASSSVQAQASSATTGVSGTVTLTPTAWGSELTMQVTGVPPRTRCTLLVVSQDGSTVRAATWWATYQGTAEVRATVAVDVASVRRIDVVDDSTHRVLLPVPVT